MLSDVKSQELQGRLMLWHMAINQARQLLDLSVRSKNATKQPNIVQARDLKSAAFKEFRQKLNGGSKGPTKLSEHVAFNASYPTPFPEDVECYSIHNACVELAIVYFCQLLNPGNKDAGVAADNRRVRKDLDKIISNAFCCSSEVDKFNRLCEELKLARNKMLAHADAPSFSIKHEKLFSSYKLYIQAWKDIDLLYWRASLDKLAHALSEYAKESREKKELEVE